ncbi:hypothetical protein C8J57DRAFT_112473 [Mycena rebaudengoi]|nr:hypothetical protein C8J57DRAFT_112473 [Mycena rebaudengoi]
MAFSLAHYLTLLLSRHPHFLSMAHDAPSLLSRSSSCPMYIPPLLSSFLPHLNHPSAFPHPHPRTHDESYQPSPHSPSSSLTYSSTVQLAIHIHSHPSTLFLLVRLSPDLPVPTVSFSSASILYFPRLLTALPIHPSALVPFSFTHIRISPMHCSGLFLPSARIF